MFGVRCLRTKPLLHVCGTCLLIAKAYGLRIGVSGHGSLFDEPGCFPRMRHVGHVAGFDFYSRGLGALCHHPIQERMMALARFAIIRSWIGLIDRSSPATMYQVGLVFHAG